MLHFHTNQVPPQTFIEKYRYLSNQEIKNGLRHFSLKNGNNLRTASLDQNFLVLIKKECIGHRFQSKCTTFPPLLALSFLLCLFFFVVSLVRLVQENYAKIESYHFFCCQLKEKQRYRNLLQEILISRQVNFDSNGAL